jgi:PEGA domain
MTRPYAFLTSVLVAAALAMPAISTAQASRRGSSGQSSGSSSGGASPRSGPGTGEAAVPRSAPAPAPRPEGASASRPSNVGGATRTPSSQSPSGSRIVRGRTATANRATSRVRGNQPALGLAQPRPAVRPGRPLVIVGPDWFSPGYSTYFGYSNYSPWSYYGGRGLWGRYGLYDPWLFDPYGYYGTYGFYGTSPYYWGTQFAYGDAAREERDESPSGALRFKVDPKSARIYIDGALAGVVDDFDGLTNHLELAPGPHQLELRADGYQSYNGQVDVKEGQTRTERISLKKK